ncbi:hypothetical protein D9M72_651920 [compost metagenome]
MHGVDHVGDDAGVVGNDAQLLPDRQSDRPVTHQPPMFFRQLVYADVVAAKHMAIARQAQEVGGQDLAAGIDDRPVFRRHRDDGGEHRQRAVVPGGDAA